MVKVGKKLLSHTDLAVVEASKVVNKLLTETGFFFYPYYLKMLGRRGLYSRGVLV